MNGLVNEWCADAWQRTYAGGRNQAAYRIEASNQFVVRGGSWFTESDSTRSGSRSFADRDKRSDGLGVRLVWSPEDEQPEPVAQGASPSSIDQS
jgi:formylglycine-generating enzyme required for sulfatase activity